MRILKTTFAVLVLLSAEQLCTVKTSDRFNINPRKILNNTAISVQLHALSVTPFKCDDSKIELSPLP